MSEEESHQQGASAVAPVERQKSPATLRRDKYRYTLTAADDEFILEMIENHKPMVFIADKIGCSRKALGEYIHSNPVLQEAFTNAKDAMDDLAEVRLFEKINQGDLGAIMFYMPRQMRHRGYGDHQVFESADEPDRIVIGHIDIPEGAPDPCSLPAVDVDQPGEEEVPEPSGGPDEDAPQEEGDASEDDGDEITDW
jgi:hypothetical protein